MSKRAIYGNDARQTLLVGVQFIVDAVASTEGPHGHNCVLGQRAIGQSPKVTKDGVTVANYVDPSDPALQLGADLIREACQKTDNVVGDGTTCTAVLARAFIEAAFDAIQNGKSPVAAEKEIKELVPQLVDHLRSQSLPVAPNQIVQVATISAHGDTEVGELVADAVAAAGIDGIVTAEPSSTSDTSVEVTPGIELPKSNLLSQAFITNPSAMKAEWNDCKILLWEGTIPSAKSLVPILNQITAAKVPLVIIAGGYEAEAISVLIHNRVKKGLQVNAVRLDAYGTRRAEVLRDIAALTGARALTEDVGVKLDNVTLADLGTARKVVTDMAKTQILDGAGRMDEIAGRIAHIKQSMETSAPEEKPILKARLAALTGGIVVVRVGAHTVTAMEEKRDRVIDALSAAKAAIKSGIVAGGGWALYYAGYVVLPLKSEWTKVTSAVIDQISKNAGIEAQTVFDTVFDHTLAKVSDVFDYTTKTAVDMIESGIIDPVDVIVEALRNAAAVACNIIMTNCIIVEEPRATEPGR